ncbi:DUF5606 domain-containing protein [Psychroflexus sp. CAK8W]|uniref:DUF5606 domain-containing protein n=1 Tax=Psychroflexus longus TaxID=2873596 RepID=A0ABS7XMP7_9FLAO|nr:DUF5606 domain-containing protein [Psychroflexus longus]MBZ9779151.1 DUF5606 domain-containing protein [Psychroflexus longus]
MKLDKVLSISGKPGLYELKAQTRGGFLAESFIDGKKIPVSMRNNVSILSEIAIYTYTEEIPLREVFQKIYEKEDGKPSINHKSSKNELTDYFSEILPEYDEDRVYPSDIKKVIQWYNLLISKNVTDFSDPKAEEDPGKEEKEN